MERIERQPTEAEIERGCIAASGATFWNWALAKHPNVVAGERAKVARILKAAFNEPRTTIEATVYKVE